MRQPKDDHWDAALYMVRYIKGILGRGIFLDHHCDLRINGWFDTDWA